MKKTMILVFMLCLLPLAAWAQYGELTPGYDGVPESYFGSWGANAEQYVVLSPTTQYFRLDSIRVFGYRAATTVRPTLNIRIEIYAPDGTALGDCGCTNAPGTLLRTYPSATGTYPLSWGTATGTKWFAIAVPQDTMTGPFIVGIKYVSATGTPGTAFPSILWDGEAGLTSCCNQYWNFQTAPGVRDNEAMFTTVPGPQYISAKGTGFGAAQPGNLTISLLDNMGGAAVDSTVTDTLIFGNSGGTTLTITSITSDNADFYTDPIGLGINIAPNATARLAVNFTPSVAGPATATLTITDNVPGAEVHTKTLTGRGVDPASLFLFENWWNGNGYEEGWTIERFGEPDTNTNWVLYYSGAHSDGYTNIWAQHDYSLAADTVLDLIGTPEMVAPAGGTVTINFRERTDYATWYWGHYLALADSDTTWTIMNEIPWSVEGEWGDYPVTYYVTGLDSAYNRFRLGFLYHGADADDWSIDDIEIRNVPDAPPFLSSEPRGDAFSSDNELVADAFDPNSDPFTVTAYISADGGPAMPFVMPEDAPGSGHFCLPFTNFLSGAGDYSYYLEATDVDGTTRWPETGTYSFEVASQTGATHLVYHDGSWENAHYFFDMGDQDAVRFTPPSYPFLLTGATVGIINFFPNAVHEHVIVTVYDDDGATGLPGTVLYQQETGSIGNECEGLGTGYAVLDAPAVIDPGILITSGTVYVSVKNLPDAVPPVVEAWGLDTLGSGTSYIFDASANAWTVAPDTVGDAMITAYGFTVPNPPVVTARSNADNSGLNLFIGGVAGAIPPTNVYVANTPNGAPSLLPGSPFTTSPVVYNYPVGVNKAFFYAAQVYGSLELIRQVPEIDPTCETARVITPGLDEIPVAAPAGVANLDLSKPLPAPQNFKVPTLIAVNNVTGERRISTLGERLGHGQTAVLPAAATTRGPVRSTVSATDRMFEAVLAK